MQRPERAVPEDERVASSHRGAQDLADADLVVAGWVVLHQPALEPRRAAVDQRDPVGAQPVRKGAPPRVDRRRQAGEPVAMNSCALFSTLTLNALVSSTVARVTDSRSSPTITIGGSSEIETS